MAAEGKKPTVRRRPLHCICQAPCSGLADLSGRWMDRPIKAHDAAHVGFNPRAIKRHETYTQSPRDKTIPPSARGRATICLCLAMCMYGCLLLSVVLTVCVSVSSACVGAFPCFSESSVQLSTSHCFNFPPYVCLYMSVYLPVCLPICQFVCLSVSDFLL